ncbi:MAG: DUF4349 domain-containing protein [Chitinophagaceae bacterium]|nr:MAG: DUF4349 domain-containing protein [Chitinophagaceae bacterium]
MKPARLLFFIAVTLFLNACQNDSKQSSPDRLSQTLSDSTSVSGLGGDSVKLVKTAALQVKVRSVEEGVKTLSELTRQHGGMVYQQRFQAVEGERKELPMSTDSLLVITTVTPQASVTVRVPSAALETFLFDAAKLGYFTSTNELHIDDKSLAYLENNLKQKAREEQLYKKGSAKRDSTLPLQALQLKDEAIDQLITNKQIAADAAYSTVDLSLYQNTLVGKEMIANYTLSGYELSFGARLSQTLKDGWNALLNFLLLLLNFWAFALSGLLFYLAYRTWRKRAAQPPTQIATSEA